MLARPPRLSPRAALRASWTQRLVIFAAIALMPLAAAGAGLPAAPAPPDMDIQVRVQKAGAEILVDVDCPVAAPVPIASNSADKPERGAVAVSAATNNILISMASKFRRNFTPQWMTTGKAMNLAGRSFR